jgi:hypothetical protein
MRMTRTVLLARTLAALLVSLITDGHREQPRSEPLPFDFDRAGRWNKINTMHLSAAESRGAW